jgi:CubicO group peptidase (beta-lactamase class C family)
MPHARSLATRVIPPKELENEVSMTSNFWHLVQHASVLIALTLPIVNCAVLASGTSSDVVAVNEAETIYAHGAAIDGMLSKYFKPTEPGATVIVSQHGVVLFRKAYGIANTSTRTPLQPDMPLRVGSVTKQFTAAAIMLLVDQGKLSLSEELGKYLPQVPEPARHVTVENLLTHTSGIRNYIELPKFGAVMTQDVSVGEAIRFFVDAPLQFPAGQRFAYSNSNYFLLGSIIEKVSGQCYADFMQQQIFQPLQMHNTFIETVPGAAAVIGYTQSWRGITNVAFYSMSWPFAAGALRTSVDDLVLWDRAIAQGKLLRRESWDRMATNTTLNGGGRTDYGYGWFIRKLGDSQALQHSGDIGGFSADTWRFPERELFIAVLANNDSHQPGPDFIAEKIARIVLHH